MAAHFSIGSQLPKVLILGHSFISRLEDFCASTGRYDMGLNQCQVAYEGISGGTPDSIRERAVLRRHSVVRSFRPHLVILQTGGNALCDPDKTALSVGYNITNLVDLLLEEFGVQRVVVCEVFRRPWPRNVSPIQYMCKRDVVNQYLSTVIGTTRGARFWEHNKLMHVSTPVFSSDGVHLNDEGLERFYRSIRGSIQKALSPTCIGFD